jgi:chromosome segregation ATPase
VGGAGQIELSTDHIQLAANEEIEEIIIEIPVNFHSAAQNEQTQFEAAETAILDLGRQLEQAQRFHDEIAAKDAVIAAKDAEISNLQARLSEPPKTVMKIVEIPVELIEDRSEEHHRASEEKITRALAQSAVQFEERAETLKSAAESVKTQLETAELSLAALKHAYREKEEQSTHQTVQIECQRDEIAVLNATLIELEQSLAHSNHQRAQLNSRVESLEHQISVKETVIQAKDAEIVHIGQVLLAKEGEITLRY